MRVGGIVLCGGRSSRMGRPKAWLLFGDELMLQRVVRILREVVEPVVVVAAPGQDVPPLPSEIAIVRDESEGRGPLAGLAAGLAALEGNSDAAYLSSCDVPFLRVEFVRRVLSFLPSPLGGEGGKSKSPSPRSATSSTRSPPSTASPSARRSRHSSPPIGSDPSSSSTRSRRAGSSPPSWPASIPPSTPFAI